MTKLKTIHLVIGYLDTSIVKDAWLSSNGIETDNKFFLMAVNIDEFEDIGNAIAEMENKAGEYDYMEVKTVYRK